MISPSPILFMSRCPIAPAARRWPLPDLPGWRRLRPAARSGGGPIRDRSVRSVRGAGFAVDVVLDFAERRHPASGVSTDRCASRPRRSSSSGGPASRSSAPFRDGRLPRSPRGAEASAALARSGPADRRSDGQSLAPLGSTTSEHAASALRSHPGHEAMLALARTLLGLIRPLRHGCVPFPRSTFTVRASKHTNGWRPASLRTKGVGPSRSGSRFYRRAGGRSNKRHDGPDPLPRRFGRCYSGATPGPDRPMSCPISARRRTHQPTRRPRRSVRSTSV